MKLSAKTRYALASMLVMASDTTGQTRFTVSYLADTLGISKDYLEQILSFLRRGRFITSVKGAQGGYRLDCQPEQITVYDILTTMESAAFEPTASTTPHSAPHIESALSALVYKPMDRAVQTALSGITLAQLRDQLTLRSMSGYMYYL